MAIEIKQTKIAVAKTVVKNLWSRNSIRQSTQRRLERSDWPFGIFQPIRVLLTSGKISVKVRRTRRSCEFESSLGLMCRLIL